MTPSPSAGSAGPLLPCSEQSTNRAGVAPAARKKSSPGDVTCFRKAGAGCQRKLRKWGPCHRALPRLHAVPLRQNPVLTCPSPRGSLHPLCRTQRPGHTGHHGWQKAGGGRCLAHSRAQAVPRPSASRPEHPPPPPLGRPQAPPHFPAAAHRQHATVLICCCYRGGIRHGPGRALRPDGELAARLPAQPSRPPRADIRRRPPSRVPLHLRNHGWAQPSRR